MISRTTLVGVLFFFSFEIFANAQYTMWFQPGVQITKASESVHKSLFYLTPFQFQSTMIVPALSTGSGYHAVWPGLENASDGFVYQNIVSDSNGAGQWEFWVEYCCECV
jgi:hypothetical protein